MTSSARSGANVFASLELDRCAEQREDHAWIDSRARAANARYLIIRADGSALMSADRQTLLHLDRTLHERIAPQAVPSFLGCVADVDHFVLGLDDDAAA